MNGYLDEWLVKKVFKQSNNIRSSYFYDYQGLCEANGSECLMDEEDYTIAFKACVHYVGKLGDEAVDFAMSKILQIESR